MPCFYCGKRISMVRQMADQDFCSDEHRRRYQDLGSAILRRLSETDSRPAARTAHGPARPPAAGATPAPRPAHARPAAPKPIVPPPTGVTPGRLPAPSGIISAFLVTPSDGGFTGPAPGLPALDARPAQLNISGAFTFLSAATPRSRIDAASKPCPEPPLAFANRSAVFGAFAPLRALAPGPRSFGFVLTEREFRAPSARRRIAQAPRLAGRFPLLPEIPVPPAAGTNFPAAGPVRLVSTPAAPVAAHLCAAPFAPIAPAAARLDFRRVATAEAPAGVPVQPLASHRVCLESAPSAPATSTEAVVEGAWPPSSQFGFEPCVPALAVPRTAGAAPASELPLRGPAPSWPPLTVAAPAHTLPRQAPHLAAPDLSLRPMRAARVPLEPVITASPMRILTRVARLERHALPPAEALPVVTRALQIVSRYVAAGDAKMSRPAALPAIPATLCSSMPPAAPHWRPVLAPQSCALGSKVFDFLDRPLRAAFPLRLVDRGGERTLQMTGLAHWPRAAARGFAPCFISRVSAGALTVPAVRVPASPSPGALAGLLPAPNVKPVAWTAKPVQIGCSIRASGAAFNVGVRLLPVAKPLRPARAIAVQALLPTRITLTAVRRAAEVAAADIPARSPQARDFRVPALCAGLKQAGALPVPAHAVNLPALRLGDEWGIRAARAIQFARAVTRSAVAPRLTPARAVIANVRLTAVHMDYQPASAAEAPEFAMVVPVPDTPACGRPALLPLALMGEKPPVVHEAPSIVRPRMCTEDLPGPGAVSVLNRIAPLPRPGYPAHSFIGYEVLDFDDDDTCVLAGAVEPEQPAPVLPRRRTSVPPVRVFACCEPLPDQAGGQDGQPVMRPGFTVEFRPGVLVMPAGVSPEIEDDAYPLAAGEGLQPRAVRSAGSRLFR